MRLFANFAVIREHGKLTPRIVVSVLHRFAVLLVIFI